MYRQLATRAVLLVALLSATTGVAEAQLGCVGAQCTIEISMPVIDVLRLTLSTTNVSLGTPTESDYTAGYRDFGGAAVNVTAKGNRPFRVDVSGATGFFSYAGSLTDPAKPASDLLWATSAAGLGSTTNHMGAPSTLINQSAGAITTPMFLRTRWDFARDVPGTYSLAIRLTLSAP